MSEQTSFVLGQTKTSQNLHQARSASPHHNRYYYDRDSMTNLVPEAQANKSFETKRHQLVRSATKENLQKSRSRISDFYVWPENGKNIQSPRKMPNLNNTISDVNSSNSSVRPILNTMPPVGVKCVNQETLNKSMKTLIQKGVAQLNISSPGLQQSCSNLTSILNGQKSEHKCAKSLDQIGEADISDEASYRDFQEKTVVLLNQSIQPKYFTQVVKKKLLTESLAMPTASAAMSNRPNELIEQQNQNDFSFGHSSRKIFVVQSSTKLESTTIIDEQVVQQNEITIECQKEIQEVALLQSRNPLQDNVSVVQPYNKSVSKNPEGSSSTSSINQIKAKQDVQKLEDAAPPIKAPQLTFRPGQKMSYRQKFGNKENTKDDQIKQNFCRYCNSQIQFYQQTLRGAHKSCFIEDKKKSEMAIKSKNETVFTKKAFS